MIVARVGMGRMAWLVVMGRFEGVECEMESSTLIVTDTNLDILASGCEKPAIAQVFCQDWRDH